jgi:hypothetical protein
LEFAKLLITFPSASRAYSMDNCDHCVPKVIAEKEGHEELVNFFENYVSFLCTFESGKNLATALHSGIMMWFFFLPQALWHECSQYVLCNL